jgi:hypothetical protein
MRWNGTAIGWMSVCLVVGPLVAASASPAQAQGSADPNPGAVTLTAGFDFANAYFFRGIPQDDTGVVMWPSGDLGFALFSGDGALKSVGVNIGTWNSLHTGQAGSDGPSGKLWYESDFYAGASLGFGKGTSLGVTYTAYTSPNGLFGTVKEISFRLIVDDSGLLGAAAVKPYMVLAQELDGQADGGANEGTYLEIGIGPGYAASRASLTVPIKVGLSLSDYYEGVAGDDTFGFFSVAGVVTVPFTSMPTRFGSWNIHGGVEFLMLGDRNEAVFGDSSHVIGSIGIGLSY